jgi:uncharacterized protein YjhX (UPF0386 family)
MHRLILSALLCCAPAALAHHSYAGFDPDERYVFEGTITAIFWGNPHILFTVDDGNTAMRIEWITTSGAIKTDVDSSRFQKGERLTVIGSRNRNPEIHVMTAIKELRLPAHDWQWISPSVQEKRP